MTAAVSPESVDFELHREAIGYMLVVPPGQTVALSLTYSGPFVDAAADPVRYVLSWTKEIGASAWPVAVTVRAGGGEQHLSSDLTVDRRWSVIAG